MSTKVTEIFPERVLEHNQNHKRKRNIREVRTDGRGQDGGGRGRSGGRGGRFGRGGGRGRGRGSYVLNGVDVSDVHKDFSQEEMNQLGPAGQSYVFQQRNRDRNRGGFNRGGRGRGRDDGRGRGRGRRVHFVNQVDINHDEAGDGQPDEAAAGEPIQQPVTFGNRGARNGARFGRGAYGN